MLSALLLLILANHASALVGTPARGSTASAALRQHHAQTSRTSTTEVPAAPRVVPAAPLGGLPHDLERAEVDCVVGHDSRPGGGNENYWRGLDARSSRRAFLSKVAAFAGAAAGVLPAAVAGARQVRSVGEVKKGIEEDFRSRYVKFPSVYRVSL